MIRIKNSISDYLWRTFNSYMMNCPPVHGDNLRTQIIKEKSELKVLNVQLFWAIQVNFRYLCLISDPFMFSNPQAVFGF